MSVKLIERRIEKLEADRSGGVVILWAEPNEDSTERVGAAMERDPWATVLVIRWQS